MLKINKTLPKYKARCNDDWRDISCISRVGYLGLATLICGIMPGLMGLSYYNNGSSFEFGSNKVSAAGYDITQISTMQEMQPYICDNTTIGQSTTLTDTRDNSTYTVAKLADGKCWMTQNLRIVDKTITPEDSDVTEDFAIPVSSEEGFSDDAAANVYYGGDEDYGAYYTWCAATAGCRDINGNNPEANMDATSSICPKGWKLPVGGNNSAFQTLFTHYPNDNTKSPLETYNNISGFWFGAGSTSTGGAFFPAAGSRYNGTPYDVDLYGNYWSSTAASDYEAYYFFFATGNISQTTNGRTVGYSVRCLAQGWPEKDVNVVAVRVAPVISIDAVSGMTEEVEPHKVTEGTISATVSANTTYDVLLSTNNTSLTNPEDKDGSLPSIPAVSSTNPVQPNTNAWGIKTSTNTYLPITTTPTSFYNTTNYDETTQSTTHTFTIGVSVAPSLPAGEYSTTVTITAVNN